MRFPIFVFCFFASEIAGRVFTDLDNDGQEQTVTLAQDKMRKLLKWVVHSLEIFMWTQDCCGGSYSEDVDLNCLDDDGDVLDKVGELYLELFDYFDVDEDFFNGELM